MLNSQSAKLDTLHRLNEESLLFQSILEISDDAVFIVSKSDFEIIDCNSSAIKLFEAKSKKDLVSLPLFSLYNFKPLDLGLDKLTDELEKHEPFTQELSFRTQKQNIFWGKLVQKNVPFYDLNYSVFKITKSANYLREEEWLSEVLKVTSKATGRQYFKEIAKFLCRTFDAKYTFIARRVSDDKSRLKIFYWHGDRIKNRYISINNSFIENTLRGVTSYYPTGLGDLFPEDKVIKATSARSFIGTPIFDVNEQVFGVIGVLSSEPMEELPNSRYMLSILGTRAASEIQRIRSKELLRQQTRELAEINLMKDKLISVISDDLQTPLNAILNYSDIIKSSNINNTSEAIVGNIELVDSTLRNLNVFIENALNLNKLQQNDVRYQLNSLSIKSFTNEIKVKFSCLKDLKQITFQNILSADFCVSADIRLLQVAIQNSVAFIIKNSAKNVEVVFDSILQNGKIYFVLKSDSFHANINDVKFCLEAKLRELYNAPKALSVSVLGLFISKEFMRLQGGELKYVLTDSDFELWLGLNAKEW